MIKIDTIKIGTIKIKKIPCEAAKTTVEKTEKTFENGKGAVDGIPSTAPLCFILSQRTYFLRE
jgi:hypothetical protein